MSTTNTRNQAFLPPSAGISSQIVNDFISLQSERVRRDGLLDATEAALAKAKIDAQGDVQQELIKQQTKRIEAERKAQEAALKEQSDIVKKLPVAEGGSFNSHAQVGIQGATMIREELPEMIEVLGVDGATAVVNQFSAIQKANQSLHTRTMTSAFGLVDDAMQGKQVNAEAGTVESFDLDALQEASRIANMPDRFRVSHDPNFNFFVTDNGYELNSGEKVQGLGTLPLDQWALAIKDQDVPSLFRSRPKLNYSRTIEEFFNSQVADNKGNVRMPSAFETDQNLDRYLALNLQGPQFDESGNLISPASPMFNTAISQRAIDQGTSFQSVYNDPFESAQAREDFEEMFRGMVSDFRATQPKKGSKSKSNEKTGADVMEEAGFKGVDTGGIQQVAELFAGDMAGPVSPTDFGLTGLASIPSVQVDFDDEFVSLIESEPGKPLKVNRAAFDREGRIYVELSGSFKVDEYADIDAAKDAGIMGESFEPLTRGVILDFTDPHYQRVLQSIGSKAITSNSQINKIQAFYDNVDSPSEANFFIGATLLARATNPDFEKTLAETIDSSYEGFDYQQLKAALR